VSSDRWKYTRRDESPHDKLGEKGRRERRQRGEQQRRPALVPDLGSFVKNGAKVSGGERSKSFEERP